MRISKTIRVVRLSLLFCLALAWSSAPAQAADGQRWAVVVGVNQYVQLSHLNFCVADARKLRDQLVSAGFPADNVFLLVDGPDARSQPNRANIQRQIGSVLAVAAQDDLVLVSFSGHGVHLDGKSYFCPAEASLDDPQTTMVPLELIYQQLEASKARQKLLLVDACRNDPRPSGSRDATSHQRSLKGLADQLAAVPAGILALSSSAAGQISWEDEQFGHGVFMHYVMEGLSGQADVQGNRDGAVSLLELYAYSELQTKRWVLRNKPGYLQTPELLGKITGDFPLGRKASPPLAQAPFSATAARGHQQAWAKYLGQPIDLTNTQGMKLTLIPPGEFVMGSTLSAEEIDRRLPGGKPEYYADEHPHHAVRLTRPFYLGTHEVTVADFRRFVTATGHKTTAEKEGNALGYKDGKWEEVAGLNWQQPGFDQQDTHPVTCVSWEDASAFCQWLSREDGRSYRLPTEAEWEYACRAGTETIFFWGDDPDAGEGYLNGADETGTLDGRSWAYKFNFKDGYAATSPVGRFKPNAFGLYDVLGNVNEWCHDWSDGSYYAASPVDDPPGAAAGSLRVRRGGSWSYEPGFCRSAYRIYATPGYRSVSLGFRVASSSVDASK